MNRILAALAILAMVSAAAAQQVTKDEIVKLVKSGTSDDAVIARIDHDKPAFTLSADDIAGLKKDGVGERVIRRMMACLPPDAPPDRPRIDRTGVVLLAKAGLGDALIIAKIDQDDSKFVLTADDKLALKKEGVGDKVIQRMVAGKKARAAVSKEEAAVELKPRPARPVESRPIVAIAGFADKSGAGMKRLGDAASDILEVSLLKSEQVRCVESERVGRIKDEMKLERGAAIDPAVAARIGKRVDAKYVAYGTILELAVREKQGGILLTAGKAFVAECELEIHVVDVATGELLYSQKGHGQRIHSGAAPGPDEPPAEKDPAMAEGAVRAAIVKLLDDILDQLE